MKKHHVTFVVKHVFALGVSLMVFLPMVGYVTAPDYTFPTPPPGSVESSEPADTETPARRAYFTDYTREEVMQHYAMQLTNSPTLRLNYPPEDAQTLIRDQTRSTFLEELVHPLRQSLYINGFEPKIAKDDIWYKGTHFRQKLIVRSVTSPVWARVVVTSLISVLTYFLTIGLINSIASFLIGTIRFARYWFLKPRFL